jgi:endonuclease YncB( thermonuclease family)
VRSRALRSLLVLLLVGFAIGADGSAARTGTWAVVESVTDGDTLRLTNGQRVRLVQIDTPELFSAECYGRAARAALLRLTPPGSRVELEADPSLDQVDRFGRLLRYLRRGTTNVNVALVRIGAAAPWFYEGDRGKYATRLLREATRAKAAKRGLWSACPGTVLDPAHGIETGARRPSGRALG